MNLNEKNTFEEQLRQFKPSKTDPHIEFKISDGLDRSSRADRRLKVTSIFTRSGVVVAASVLIGFGFLLFNGRISLNSGQPEPLPDESEVVNLEPQIIENNPDTFKPVLAENNLQSRVDEGIVFLRNGLTARRYRYEFLDRVVWKNPSNGAVVEMEIPRDEVILVPVQTY